MGFCLIVSWTENMFSYSATLVWSPHLIKDIDIQETYFLNLLIIYIYILYIVFIDFIIDVSLLAYCPGGGLEKDNLFHLLSQFFTHLIVYVYVYICF